MDPSQLGTPTVIMCPRVTTTPTVFFTVRKWYQVSIVKNSSGTVVIGTDSSIQAIALGGGISLLSGTQVTFMVAPGTTLYAVGSTDSESIGVAVQSLEMIPTLFTVLGVK